MVIDFTLLGTPLYIDQPQELIGWVGWLLFAGCIALLLFRWRHLNKKWTGLQGGIFIGLFVLLILTNIIFKIQIPALGSLQVGSTSTTETAVAVLAALPWVLAAGLLGVFPAAGLGLEGELPVGQGPTSRWEDHRPVTAG